MLVASLRPLRHASSQAHVRSRCGTGKRGMPRRRPKPRSRSSVAREKGPMAPPEDTSFIDMSQTAAHCARNCGSLGGSRREANSAFQHGWFQKMSQLGRTRWTHLQSARKLTTLESGWRFFMPTTRFSGKRKSGKSSALTRSCQATTAPLPENFQTCVGHVRGVPEETPRAKTAHDAMRQCALPSRLHASRPIQVIILHGQMACNVESMWDCLVLRPVDGNATPCCRPTGLFPACSAPDGPVKRSWSPSSVDQVDRACNFRRRFEHQQKSTTAHKSDHASRFGVVCGVQEPELNMPGPQAAAANLSVDRGDLRNLRCRWWLGWCSHGACGLLLPRGKVKKPHAHPNTLDRREEMWTQANTARIECSSTKSEAHKSHLRGRLHMQRVRPRR